MTFPLSISSQTQLVSKSAFKESSRADWESHPQAAQPESLYTKYQMLTAMEDAAVRKCTQTSVQCKEVESPF